MITAAQLGAALLDVGRPVTDEDAAFFGAIDPEAEDAPFAITMAIAGRFPKPGPPPQVHAVWAALIAARRDALRLE